MNQWCILRCNGRATIKLAASLVHAGIPAWTPVETIKRRPPRHRGSVPVQAPVMPTFVFADALRLHDLIRLADSYISPHPDFSVFRHYDKFPLIADRELAPLRAAERKGTPIEAVGRFDPGMTVRTPDGAFAGMSGIVETDKGKFVMVLFPGFALPVKIARLHLVPESGKSSPIQADADQPGGLIAWSGDTREPAPPRPKRTRFAAGA